MRRMGWVLVAVWAAELSLSCGGDPGSCDGGACATGGTGGGGTGGGLDSGAPDAGLDGGRRDAGTDAGALLDAGIADAGLRDAGSTLDAGTVDAGGSLDAGAVDDGGSTADAGAPADAGPGLVSLDIVLAGSGTGTVSGPGFACTTDCTQQLALDTMVTLSATASGGSTFTGWSGSCTGVGSCTVTLSSAQVVTATFHVPHTLTVFNTRLGGATGAITSSPPGINCGPNGPTCTFDFLHGTTVYLTATAAADGGSWFSRWAGACSNRNTVCSVNLTQPQMAVATFSPPTNYLFVSSVTTVPGALNGPAGGDAFCQALATDAGLPGTFVALLPSQTQTALQRLSGARGFVRPDGRPVMDLMSDNLMDQNRLLYPPVMTEKRTLDTSGYVVTGSTSSGTAHINTCQFWTSTSGTAHQAAPSALIGSQWFGLGGTYDAPCIDPAAVYCAGIDSAKPLVVVKPSPSRTVFTSESAFVPGGGLPSADALCQAEATTQA